MKNEVCTRAEHPPETFKSLLKMPFKIATSLSHYSTYVYACMSLQRCNSVSRDTPTLPGKLHLIKGENVRFSCCIDSRVLPLHLCYMAALVPCLSTQSGRKGRKSHADHNCTHVHVRSYVISPAFATLPITLISSDQLVWSWDVATDRGRLHSCASNPVCKLGAVWNNS